MKIKTFSPDDKPSRRAFIALPFRLYENSPCWVPPLQSDIRQIFDTRRHGFYLRGDARFLLAYEDERVVGRLVVLHDRHAPSPEAEKSAHFYLFEAENDFAIAEGLFSAGIDWAKSRGCTRLFGPKGMTPLDGLGMLTRGFDIFPAFGMPYNHDYYPRMIERLGFQKLSEALSGVIRFADFNLPPRIRAAAELVEKRKGFRVLELRTRKDLKNAIGLLGAMYNGALRDTSGVLPLQDQDLRSMARGLLWIAQPELVKLVLKDDQPIGFLLAYPDISRGLKATAGRLLPLGWIRLLWEKYHTSRMDINGIGIIAEYRGMAATAVLFNALFETVSKTTQFSYAEVVQIGTENVRMQRELRGIGVDFNRTHTQYEMHL